MTSATLSQAEKIQHAIDNAHFDFFHAFRTAIKNGGGKHKMIKIDFLFDLLAQYAGKSARSVTIQIYATNLDCGTIAHDDMIAICAAHARHVSALADKVWLDNATIEASAQSEDRSLAH
jgi:hypothetical protein